MLQCHVLLLVYWQLSGGSLSSHNTVCARLDAFSVDFAQANPLWCRRVCIANRRCDVVVFSNISIGVLTCLCLRITFDHGMVKEATLQYMPLLEDYL